MTEYLLDPKNERLTMFPIKELEIWNFYKKMEAAIWHAQEVDFSKDYGDFQKLNKDEQNFIKMVLAFFAASDRIVNINLGERFTQEIKIMEIVVAYQFQIMMENIHSETYALMIDNIIRDNDEKTKLFNAIENFDCIKKKADWARKWIEDKDACLHQRVIAFSFVEGVHFSGSFAAIYWLKKNKNLMRGLCDSNELISRDEGMHTQMAVLVSKRCEKKVSQEIVHQMAREAVEIEKEFMCESLNVSLLGMNSTLMCNYIEYVADRLLIMLGYEKIWNTDNPFDFMEAISMEAKTNFFESRPTQYQKAAVLNTGTENVFEDDEDF